MGSVPDVKRRTLTNDNGRVHPANAASLLVAHSCFLSTRTAGTEPPMSPTVTVLRHNLANNAEAAALQLEAAAAAAAAAVAAAECKDRPAGQHASTTILALAVAGRCTCILAGHS